MLVDSKVFVHGILNSAMRETLLVRIEKIKTCSEDRSAYASLGKPSGTDFSKRTKQSSWILFLAHRLFFIA